MTALSTLTFKDQENITINPAVNVTGGDYSPQTAPATVAKTISLGTAAANAAVGGADQAYSTIVSIAGGGTGTIDLTSFTDMLGRTANAFVRVKEIIIRLLSVADDSVVGTAASSVTLDGTAANGFTGQSNSGGFDNATSKLCCPNGGKIVPLALGNAAGVAVDSTHKILSIKNNDGSVTAKVQVTVIGGTS